MKRFLLFLFISISFLGSSKAQTVSINAFGGFNFQDHVQLPYTYGWIREGGFWGASIESIGRRGHAIELLYQGQNPQVPLYYYNSYGGQGGQQANSGKEATSISYILLNGIQYLQANEHVQPYGGLGIGMAIANQAGQSATKFAWDLKLGVKIKTQSVVGIKLQAQLISAAQYVGGGVYIGGGGTGVGVSTYSTIYQFGFMGGLTFDLKHHK